MVKIEYKNPDKGYVGKGIGKVLRFPRVGIYEVKEKEAQYLVKTFPDWFAYAYKTSQDPPDNPPLGSAPGTMDEEDKEE